MQRKASAVWQGDLKSGKGSISTDSGVLKQTQYSFTTRFEKLGDRAAGFGGLDGGVELRLIRSGNAGQELEMALGDAEAVADFFEADGCGGFQLLSGQTGIAELCGERHGETTGVSGGQEFFRIGADPILKSRAKGILRLLEHATIC